MLFMNEYDIDDALIRFGPTETPHLAAGAEALVIGRMEPRRTFTVPEERASDDLCHMALALEHATYRLQHGDPEPSYDLDGCRTCKGTGVDPANDDWDSCPTCYGDGTAPT